MSVVDAGERTLFDVGSESTETFDARVVIAAQKAIGRIDVSVGEDLDRLERALRAGGTYAEMKALVTAHESLVGVHHLLRQSAADITPL